LEPVSRRIGRLNWVPFVEYHPRIVLALDLSEAWVVLAESSFR